MLNREWKWHYFMLHGIEYLVLGYNSERHNVLCVSFQHFHTRDKEDLMWIVDSDEGQREAYLVSILARHPYAGGGTWWERLQPHVFFADIAQIKNHIPPEQIDVFMDAFYKKHGKTAYTTKPIVYVPDGRKRWWETVSFSDVPEIVENSTTEPTKIENIDSILFGPVLSVDDRKEIAEIARLAGL